MFHLTLLIFLIKVHFVSTLNFAQISFSKITKNKCYEILEQQQTNINQSRLKQKPVQKTDKFSITYIQAYIDQVILNIDISK